MSNDQQYALDGFKLSQKDADKLEAQLATNPDNWLDRARILNFYSVKSREKGVDKKRLPHILWMIRNKPDISQGYGAWSMDPQREPDGAKQIREEWIRALDKDPDNLPMIQNAVSALILSDRGLCERLLLRAKELDPNNAFWSGRLAQIYQMNASQKMLNVSCGEPADTSAETAGTRRELESALERAKDRRGKLRILDLLLQISKDDPANIRAGAEEMLSIAGEIEDDEYGQAVYRANFALAQLAFHEQNYDDATKYLLRASETPGSRELAMMGPDYGMASALWEQGKQQEVKRYIENCSGFWTNDMGASQRWLKQIAEGQVPDFEKHQLNAQSAMGMVGLAAKLLFKKRK